MGTNRKKIKIINNVFNKFLKNITFISYPPLGRGNAFSRIINAHDEYFWTFSLSGWEDQYNIYDSLSFTESQEGQEHGKLLFQTIAHQPLFIYWRHNIKNISLKKQFEEFIEEGTDHAKKDFIKCIKSNKLYCIPTHEKIEIIKKIYPDNLLINFWSNKEKFLKEKRTSKLHKTTFMNIFKEEYYFKEYPNVININKDKLFSKNWYEYSEEFDKLSTLLKFHNPRKNAVRAFILMYLERDEIFGEQDSKKFTEIQFKHCSWNKLEKL